MGSLADLRVRKLRLQVQALRPRLEGEYARLLWADEVRAAGKRHAEAVRCKVRALPARMTARLAAWRGVDAEDLAGVVAIIAAEMKLVADEVQDDPLAASVTGR